MKKENHIYCQECIQTKPTIDTKTVCRLTNKVPDFVGQCADFSPKAPPILYHKSESKTTKKQQKAPEDQSLKKPIDLEPVLSPSNQDKNSYFLSKQTDEKPNTSETPQELDIVQIADLNIPSIATEDTSSEAENTSQNAPQSSHTKKKNKDALLLLEAEEENAIVELLEKEQSLVLGILASIIAAIVLSLGLGILASISSHSLGFGSIFVGVTIAFIMREVGRGVSQVFGVIAVLITAITVFACLYCTTIAATNAIFVVSLPELVLSISPKIGWEIMQEKLGPLDAIYAFISLIISYFYAFRRLGDKEIYAYKARLKKT